MNPGFLFRAALVSLVIALCGPAMAASNLTFLKDSPLQQFTKQDMQIFKQTLGDMLDKAAVGDSKKWSNPATEATGEIKVVKSFDRKGTPCRTMWISNSANGLQAAGQYNFCKPASTGKWGLAN